MNLKSTKVVIIGVGNVGATCAYTIVNMGLCDQLCLIDMNQEKAIGEAMDLTHAVHFMNRNMQVYAGGYSDCSDADAIITDKVGKSQAIRQQLKKRTYLERILDAIL